jgi:hypothetical protein
MYSFQWKSDRLIFIPRRVKARIYIYSSQLTLILTNLQAKQNDVIRELETRYMLWPGIKNHMYSFLSKSDWIIFIPRRVKARLYIWLANKFNRNDTPRETKRCYSRTQNALCCGQEWSITCIHSNQSLIG